MLRQLDCEPKHFLFLTLIFSGSLLFVYLIIPLGKQHRPLTCLPQAADSKNKHSLLISQISTTVPNHTLLSPSPTY